MSLRLHTTVTKRLKYVVIWGSFCPSLRKVELIDAYKIANGVNLTPFNVLKSTAMHSKINYLLPSQFETCTYHLRLTLLDLFKFFLAVSAVTGCPQQTLA